MNENLSNVRTVTLKGFTKDTYRLMDDRWLNEYLYLNSCTIMLAMQSSVGHT